VNDKREQVAAIVEGCRGRNLDAHYLAFFDCFNRGWYYEAHEVLETPWHVDRHGPNGAFYKGLIQLAGAFVHLQKNRLCPAIALLRLSGANLAKYPAVHEQLDVRGVISLTARWVQDLESSGDVNPLRAHNAPKLGLLLAGADI
jgi:predicted metal-dependent hydrolase